MMKANACQSQDRRTDASFSNMGTHSFSDPHHKGKTINVKGADEKLLYVISHFQNKGLLGGFQYLRDH